MRYRLRAARAPVPVRGKARNASEAARKTTLWVASQAAAVPYDKSMSAADMRRRLRQGGHEALRARLDGPGGDSQGTADILFRARYGCYLVLGFDREQAFFLAMAPEVGVLDALNLIESDCPPETAVAILV